MSLDLFTYNYCLSFFIVLKCNLEDSLGYDTISDDIKGILLTLFS